jgi:hypothetical protein
LKSLDFIDFVKKFRVALILLIRVLNYYKKIEDLRSSHTTSNQDDLRWICHCNFLGQPGCRSKGRNAEALGQYKIWIIWKQAPWGDPKRMENELL